MFRRKNLPQSRKALLFPGLQGTPPAEQRRPNPFLGLFGMLLSAHSTSPNWPSGSAFTANRNVGKPNSDCPKHPDILPFPKRPLNYWNFIQNLYGWFQSERKQARHPSLTINSWVLRLLKMFLKTTKRVIRFSDISDFPGSGVVQGV